MSYEIINPPFTLVFREMAKKELKCYFSWFMNIMPERINMLIETVKSTSGFESWEADFSPESLGVLGEWFVLQVETRPKTQDEIDAILEKNKFAVDVYDVQLSNKTYSLAIDIGIYISQILMKNLNSLEWSQTFKGKTSLDYGQPVLVGVGENGFNPVRSMVGFAKGLTKEWRRFENLRELYESSEKYLKTGQKS